ncbi:MAG: phage integrase N-terminal SAM-like domain-containing protein [Thermosynechococcaceae cyanobacterium MS004]|nr:phage integrase N-terminal SAM-like domain-containing protein [Thermosynechococcaceae cyanobacterium MS004]
MRDVLRLKQYSCRTEQSYVDGVYRFIMFHNKRHPKDMGASEIEVFLSYFAVQRRLQRLLKTKPLAL